MEENEERRVEEVAPEENKPTEAEILESAKKENKGYDEKERGEITKAQAFGFCVGMIFVGLICLINGIVLDRFPTEVMVVYTSGYCAYTLYMAIKIPRRRKIWLTVGILSAVAAAAMITLWILELCGI